MSRKYEVNPIETFFLSHRAVSHAYTLSDTWSEPLPFFCPKAKPPAVSYRGLR
ncbi:hypothetical protein ACVWXP_006148 [Bradyrhizobium sp. USDA 4463]